MRHWILRLPVFVLFVLWTGVVHSQSGPISLDQGWSEHERAWFYTTTQGSQLVPYSWYLALEQPGGGAPFGADHLARYGYLENANRTSNPDNLPLGFVKDLEQDQLGLTCAACHTNRIDFAGKTWRIDGAPTDADTWAFLRDLNTSLTETAAARTSDRFKRFAAKVATRNRTPEATLYSDLQRFSEYFSRFVDSSRTDDEWGRARLDAFGMIFNRATGIDLNEWSNTAKPNAPVSVPFLWDTHWHDVVQWNGSAPNTLAFQRLGRNVGEVLGVFASTDIKKTTLPPLYFKTSARRLNLLKIEHLLSTLRSPVWPVELGAIDKRLAAQGATLYDTYCVSCHSITPRDRPLGRSKVSVMSASDIGTDLTMVMNAKNRRAKSGFLDGVRMPPLSRSPIPSELPSVELTLRLVVGTILAPPNWRQIRNQTGADLTNLIADLKTDQDPDETTVNGRPKNPAELLADLRETADQLALQQREKTDEMKYKARPLDGIWATAPYLHNGSVPNLAELLKPEKERPAKFYVGTRYFDPKNVGFTTLKTDGAFEFDTSKPGNRNTGHNAYRPKGGGAPHVFTDAERMALVEYLKTL